MGLVSPLTVVNESGDATERKCVLYGYVFTGIVTHVVHLMYLDNEARLKGKRVPGSE